MNVLTLPDGPPPPNLATLAPTRVADCVLGPPASLRGNIPPDLLRLGRVDAAGADPNRSCRTVDGLPAADERGPVACPADPAFLYGLRERFDDAADMDGLVLERIDAWWHLLPLRAGWSDAVGKALHTHVAKHHPEQAKDEAPLGQVGRGLDGPYAGMHAGVTWQVAREGVATVIRTAREALRARGREGRLGVKLSGPGPVASVAAAIADVTFLPAPADGSTSGLAARLELVRGQSTRRPVVVELSGEAARKVGSALRAARAASAVGAETSVPFDAPLDVHAAIAAHRRFWASLRTHARPSEPLAELLVLYSPECDHRSGGRHLASTLVVAAMLSRAGVQYRVVTTLPRSGSEPILLADATHLPIDDAERLDRRVEEGSAAIVVGAQGSCDVHGTWAESPLGEPRDGLNRHGSGTVFGIDVDRRLSRQAEVLAGPLDAAVTSLVGRGRRAVAFGTQPVLVKAFLDPDEKLDVHVAARTLDSNGAPPVIRGLQLQLAGTAVGSARSGLLLMADGSEHKVTLSPYGTGVRADLPDLPGAALLTIAR